MCSQLEAISPHPHNHLSPTYFFPSSLSLTKDSQHTWKWLIVYRSWDCSATLNSLALVTFTPSALYYCYSHFCGTLLHNSRRVASNFKMVHCVFDLRGLFCPRPTLLFCIIRQRANCWGSALHFLFFNLICIQNHFNLVQACTFFSLVSD